jgi:hypothetical protein
MQQLHNGFAEEEAASAEAWEEGEAVADEMEDVSAEKDLSDDAYDDADSIDAAEDEEVDAGDIDELAAMEGAFSGEDEVFDEAIDAGESWDEGVDALGEDSAVEALFFDGIESDEALPSSLFRGAQRLAHAYGGLPSWMRKAPGQVLGALMHQPSDISRIWDERSENLGNDASVLIRQLQQRFGSDEFDVMDVFADAMVEFGESGEDLEEFVTPLSGVAARYAVKTAVPKRVRAVKKQATKALGKATVKAIEKSTRAILNKYGAKGAAIVPRVVRRVVKAVVQQRASPRTIPSTIVKTASRVMKSPIAARKLARPNNLARKVRSKAGIAPGSPRLRSVKPYVPTTLRSYRRRGARRTITLRGPVKITFRR